MPLAAEEEQIHLAGVDPDPKIAPDLDVLWNDALKRYQKVTKRPISDLDKVGDFQNALAGTSDQRGAFEKNRHPDTKVNTIINTVAPCLDWLNTGMQFIADHATGSVVAPAKAIAGAALYLIQAAQYVTADLDLIVDCFDNIREAMMDISLLRGFTPEDKHFHLRLVQVFASLLDFCGFSTTLVSKHFRYRMFVKSLISGRNAKIAEHCGKVKKAIDLFRATVPITALALQVEVKNKVIDLPENTVQAFIKAAAANKFDPSSLIPSNEPLNKIREFFAQSGGSKTSFDASRFKNISGTFDTVFNLVEYKRWSDGREIPLLWVSGPAGSGKTFFTFSMIHRLRLIQQDRGTKQDDRVVLIAPFFFSRGQNQMNKLKVALQGIIVQIAEQDAKYAQYVSKELEKTKDLRTNIEDKRLWQNYIQKMFPAKSADSAGRALIVLLDGVDQMEEIGRSTLMEIFSELSSEQSSIRIMFTSDESFKKTLDKQGSSYYENILITKHNTNDINAFIESKYQSSRVLKKLPAAWWKKAKQVLAERAQGIFAYIDVVLRRMEGLSVDQVSADKLLGEMPSGTNGLYTYMSDMLTSGISPFELKNIRILYKWLVLGRKSFTTKELNALLQIENSNTTFDIEKEIQAGLSSSVLYTQQRPQPVSRRPIQSFRLKVSAENQNEESGDLVYCDFLQTSFKDFLINLEPTKGNRLIPEPNVAKVEVFTLLCGIICSADTITSEAKALLQNYAVSSLSAHLFDIDLESANQDQASQVVESLSKLLTNTNNATNIIETSLSETRSGWESFNMYEFFRVQQVDGRTTKGVCTAWASKIRYHGTENLSVPAKRWIQTTVRSDGSKLLIPLIKGHVESCFTKKNEKEARVPYILATQAILESQFVPQSLEEKFYSWNLEISPQTVKIIRRVMCDGDRPMKLDVNGRLALAVLANSGRSDQTDKTRSFARRLYKRNLRDDVDGANRFYSLVGLAEISFQEGEKAQEEKVKEKSIRQSATFHYEEAEKNANLALEQYKLEQNPLGTDLDPTRLKMAFLLRGKALEKLGPERIDEAIETYEEALKILHYSVELEDLVEFLHKIAKALCGKEDHLGIIRRVQLWPADLRAKWLETRTYWSLSRDLELRISAVKTNRADLIVRYYENTIESLGLEQAGSSVFLKYELALIYYRDLRLSAIAKSKLLELIIETKRYWQADSFTNIDLPGIEWIMQSVHDELLSLLSEEFRYKTVLSQKQAILQEMLKLKADAEPQNVNCGYFDFALAKMYAFLGNVMETRIRMNNAFKYCIDDLEDQLSGNDSSAFRLLGKLLSFAGLTVDAQIALSLQLSSVGTVRDFASTYYAESVISNRLEEDMDDDFDSMGEDTEGTENDNSVGSNVKENEVNGVTSLDTTDLANVITLSPHLPSRNRLALDTTKWMNEEKEEKEEMQKEEEEYKEKVAEDMGKAEMAKLQKERENYRKRKAEDMREAGMTAEQIAVILEKDQVRKGLQKREKPAAGDQEKAENIDGSVLGNEIQTSSYVSHKAPAVKIALPDRSDNIKLPNSTFPTDNTINETALPNLPDDIELHDSTLVDIPIDETAPPNLAENIEPIDTISRLVQTNGETYDSNSAVGCDYCSKNEAYKFYTNWKSTPEQPDPPVWRCLACRDTDLCQKCYEIQSDFAEGKGLGFWTMICEGSKEHHYLKQPIDGWLGVKDCRIMMEGSKSKLFRNWLADVKNRFTMVNWKTVVENI